MNNKREKRDNKTAGQPNLEGLRMHRAEFLPNFINREGNM